MPDRSCVAFFHAHPDDEAIFTGGTLALLARAGHRTVVVVATSGELGLVHDAAGTELAAHRRAETRAACAELGVDAVHFLDYRDSGMPGDPANQDPEAFSVVSPDTAAADLAAVLDGEGVDTLVGYEPGGIYGHPDHVRVHQVGLLAARAAGIRTRYDATVDAEYLHFVDTHLVDHASRTIPDMPRFGSPSVLISTMVDVRPVIEQKRRSIEMHRSQLPDESAVRMMPHGSFADVYGFEWYLREGPPGALDTLAD